MDWKIGDIAICVNDKTLDKRPGVNPPLRLNAEYIIQGVKICPCGHVTLDIGISGRPSDYRCSKCSREVLNEPIWWCASSRFTKKKSKEEQMEEALKKEDYETLAILRDQNK